MARKLHKPNLNQFFFPVNKNILEVYDMFLSY